MYCYANIGVPKTPDNPFYTETDATSNPIGFNPLGTNFIDYGLGDNPNPSPAGARFMNATPGDIAQFRGLSSGDHRGDTTVQATVNPAKLVLPRRPVARHRMHMAVNQPGRENGSVRVNRQRRAGYVDLFLLADRDDLAVYRDHRVRIENRLLDVAAQQQPDVINHQPGGIRNLSRLFLSHATPPR